VSASGPVYDINWLCSHDRHESVCHQIRQMAAPSPLGAEQAFLCLMPHVLCAFRCFSTNFVYVLKINLIRFDMNAVFSSTAAVHSMSPVRHLSVAHSRRAGGQHGARGKPDDGNCGENSHRHTHPAAETRSLHSQTWQGTSAAFFLIIITVRRTLATLRCSQCLTGSTACGQQVCIGASPRGGSKGGQGSTLPPELKVPSNFYKQYDIVVYYFISLRTLR